LQDKDAVAFLEEWGEAAARFGWSPEELFGLDAAAPLARYIGWGLPGISKASESSL
jgi:hypothetical protein